MRCGVGLNSPLDSLKVRVDPRLCCCHDCLRCEVVAFHGAGVGVVFGSLGADRLGRFFFFFFFFSPRLFLQKLEKFLSASETFVPNQMREINRCVRGGGAVKATKDW